MELPKLQRNDIFRSLEKSGVPVADFTVAPLRATLLVIRHNILPSELHLALVTRGRKDAQKFTIRGLLGGGETEAQIYTRGRLQQDPVVMESSLSWDMIPAQITNWAKLVGEWVNLVDEYTEAPDLWEEFRQGAALLGTPEHVADNTPFTDAEQAQVSTQMKQIRTFIATTYELTADQLADVDARLEHIDEASHRVGRKDWLMMFNGAVLSLVFADLIPPQAMQGILMLGLQSFGHLFGLGGPPVPLP